MEYERRYVAFKTKLGWTGLIQSDSTVRRISIGHLTRQSIQNRNEFADYRSARPDSFETGLIDALSAYAEGVAVDFGDWRVDTLGMTRFEKRVSDCCRQIPFGTTLTYGQLAEQAGFPKAYRAVGSVMAKNKFPIVEPCHRVVAAGKNLGGFSSPQGVSTKIQLLEMEGVDWPAARAPKAKKLQRRPKNKKRVLASR